MAQRAFAGQDPLGRRLWTDLAPAPLLVVGVVGHVRHWGLAADDRAQVRDQFYYPFAQVSDANVRRWSELMSVAVRTAVEPLSLVETLRHELPRSWRRSGVVRHTRPWSSWRTRRWRSSGSSLCCSAYSPRSR
jgi:hypothetical protein